jgi:hypothetical protein
VGTVLIRVGRWIDGHDKPNRNFSPLLRTHLQIWHCITANNYFTLCEAYHFLTQVILACASSCGKSGMYYCTLLLITFTGTGVILSLICMNACQARISSTSISCSGYLMNGQEHQIKLNRYTYLQSQICDNDVMRRVNKKISEPTYVVMQDMLENTCQQLNYKLDANLQNSSK